MAGFILSSLDGRRFRRMTPVFSPILPAVVQVGGARDTTSTSSVFVADTPQPAISLYTAVLSILLQIHARGRPFSPGFSRSGQ